MTPHTPKDLMRNFLATLLSVAFVAANGAFIYAYLILDKPLETVGTAIVMSLINFAGMAIGYFLGSSKGSADKSAAMAVPPPPERETP